MVYAKVALHQFAINFHTMVLSIGGAVSILV